MKGDDPWKSFNLLLIRNVIIANSGWAQILQNKVIMNPNSPQIVIYFEPSIGKNKSWNPKSNPENLLYLPCFAV